jgi:hypothetical protein
MESVTLIPSMTPFHRGTKITATPVFARPPVLSELLSKSSFLTSNVPISAHLTRGVQKIFYCTFEEEDIKLVEAKLQ